VCLGNEPMSKKAKKRKTRSSASVPSAGIVTPVPTRPTPPPTAPPIAPEVRDELTAIMQELQSRELFKVVKRLNALVRRITPPPRGEYVS